MLLTDGHFPRTNTRNSKDQKFAWDICTTSGGYPVTVWRTLGLCRLTYMCPTTYTGNVSIYTSKRTKQQDTRFEAKQQELPTDRVGEKISYPEVHKRVLIIISSPMKIQGRKGSNGTSWRNAEWATKYPAAVNGAKAGYSNGSESQTPPPSNPA